MYIYIYIYIAQCIFMMQKCARTPLTLLRLQLRCTTSGRIVHLFCDPPWISLWGIFLTRSVITPRSLSTSEERRTTVFSIFTSSDIILVIGLSGIYSGGNWIIYGMRAIFIKYKRRRDSLEGTKTGSKYNPIRESIIIIDSDITP